MDLSTARARIHALLRPIFDNPTEADARETELDQRINDLLTAAQAARSMVCRDCEAPVRWVDNPNGGWWNHVSPATDGHGVFPRPGSAQPNA